MSNIQTRQTQQPPTQEVQLNKEEEKQLSSALGKFAGASLALTILVVIFLIIYVISFHVGAAMLSYHKYGSFFWAIVNFVFAWFYYPFYAFFLDTNTPPVATAPTTTETMVGGVIKMFGGRRRRNH